MNVLVDGRKIAEGLKDELRRDLREFSKRPSLGVIVATDALATRKFVERKCEFGKSIGVKVQLYELSPSASTMELVAAVRHAAGKHEGLVVQLPLPGAADVDAVRNAIPVTHDVDAISDGAIAEFEGATLPILPPVVGAIAEIVKQHNVVVSGAHAVVVGQGRLVGKPAAAWLRREGAVVYIFEKDADASSEFAQANIIVLGAGSPGLLTPSMIKEGVVIFDAGTSEAMGKLSGDADPTCAEKASLFTPVPGGIGPITVALIFRNLLVLSSSAASRQ
jgi:methylenetetrahydrofolate dehydrogenase (NADP+)/methenyltetrahydrofolate cyclohydrolase